MPPKVAQGMPNYVMEAVQLRRIQTEGVVCTYIYILYLCICICIYKYIQICIYLNMHIYI